MNTTHLIDAGNSVIRLEVAADHMHLTILSEAIHDGDMHIPPESASAFLDAEAIQSLIGALSTLKVAKLKSVDTH